MGRRGFFFSFFVFSFWLGQFRLGLGIDRVGWLAGFSSGSVSGLRDALCQCLSLSGYYVG